MIRQPEKQGYNSARKAYDNSKSWKGKDKTDSKVGSVVKTNVKMEK